ncbi:hypothetical protein FOZ60_011821 [Perkinsus olseni]|uniref:Uncharacterized protein n=1 Tax=Perkinsus olseni TaxID=32597 RepID=A0A7J6PLZ1_PEROL|nr:hypothetical protein FOZ60_011821 [Perkinsus olseni]
MTSSPIEPLALLATVDFQQSRGREKIRITQKNGIAQQDQQQQNVFENGPLHASSLFQSKTCTAQRD